MCLLQCIFGHCCHLYTATLSVAFGAGFLIYSTYVTNNVQVVGENWLNNSYAAIHGDYPNAKTLSMLWASVIASKEVGKMFGTLLIPWVAEKLGRKGGLLLNNLVTVTGCFLCYVGLTWPYYTIMFGRFLLGISMICGVGLASLFLIEVAPLSSRGSSGALIQIFRGFGGTMGMVLTLPDVLGTPTLWTLALALPAFPAILQFFVLMCCMESPRHLFITDENPVKAAKAIQFYQGVSRVSPALEDLRSEKQRIEQQTKVNCMRLMKMEDFWRPLLLTTLALTNRSLAGILLVQSYSTDMFVAAGLKHHTAAYSTVALGICHLISAIVVTFTVEKFGRRPMLIYANVGCLISLILVAICSSLSTENSYSSYLTVFFLGVFMLIYPIVASVSNIVASEICHQKIRSLAFTVGLLCYSIVGFVSTFAYPVMKDLMGVSWSYIPFCLCLVATIAVYCAFLPETRGKTFETLAFSKSFRQLEDKEPLLVNGEGMNGQASSNGDWSRGNHGNVAWDSEEDEEDTILGNQNGSLLTGQKL